MTISNQSSLAEMVTQSRAIMANPSVPTFERYERHGSLGSAAVYVLVAAVVAGILRALTALLPYTPGNPITAFLGGVLGSLVSFVLFTGLVFYLGRSLFGGTGTWDEVAYTFALFSAPLAVIGALLTFVGVLLGGIPVLGWLIGLASGLGSLVVLLLQAYFAFIAVQSSMNITDPIKSIANLLLAMIATGLGLAVLGSLSGLFPLLIGIAVVIALLFSLGVLGRGRRP